MRKIVSSSIGRARPRRRAGRTCSTRTTWPSRASTKVQPGQQAVVDVAPQLGADPLEPGGVEPRLRRLRSRPSAPREPPLDPWQRRGRASRFEVRLREPGPHVAVEVLRPAEAHDVMGAPGRAPHPPGDRAGARSHDRGRTTARPIAAPDAVRRTGGPASGRCRRTPAPRARARACRGGPSRRRTPAARGAAPWRSTPRASSPARIRATGRRGRRDGGTTGTSIPAPRHHHRETGRVEHDPVATVRPWRTPDYEALLRPARRRVAASSSPAGRWPRSPPPPSSCAASAPRPSSSSAARAGCRADAGAGRGGVGRRGPPAGGVGPGSGPRRQPGAARPAARRPRRRRAVRPGRDGARHRQLPQREPRPARPARSSPTAGPSGWRSTTRSSSTRSGTTSASTRAPSAVVRRRARRRREGARADLDAGAGTVWAADASQGWHGGAEGLRWVRRRADVDDAIARLRRARPRRCGSCRSSKACRAASTASCTPIT